VAHILDSPIWSALTGPHAHLAEGRGDVRRYRPDTVPFAAMRETNDENLAALAALPRPGEMMALLDPAQVAIPRGLVVAMAFEAAQLVLAEVPSPEPDARIAPLTSADAEEMLALATLTVPGPFTLKAQELGPFHGIRVDGRLVAMAGERMRPQGYSELSGVCTHPGFRGQGYARLLSIHVVHDIVGRRETPFLHVLTENTTAIRLYESIGFRVRSPISIRVVAKDS